MFRATIDFGIDLGTSNSTIAVIDGIDAKVITNTKQSTVTPSAVYIDKKGRLRVGEEAKEYTLKMGDDNGDVEFKLRMGDTVKTLFADSGREMLPEELSAEVLKSLRTDVRSSMNEEIDTAVITVPAAFELPQIKATSRAAELAGFRLAPILLEPVSASLAYGFQTESENAYWFVYDFGGGTFDAALMRVRDGLIQVVNHNGDNHLGGKLIDWDLVTECVAPFLEAQYKLPGFRHRVPRWKRPLGRLKYEIEKAKIQVCRTRQEVEISIDCLCEDAEGKPVEVEYTLTPKDVERISRPYIERSLGLCRRTLSEKGLTGAGLDRVLMVGGSTLNPWVREAVEADLGAMLDFGIDPVTVVARGAAIFASTQSMPGDPKVALPRGTWCVEIDSKPVGSESDPDIGGRIIPDDDAKVAGCTIELRDTKTRWSTGRIPLDITGTFMTQLYAERKRRCEFEIELLDPTGRRIPTRPDRVFYTIGAEPAKPPCTQSIGIGLADGQVAKFVEKGQSLPAKGQRDVRTTVALRAGRAEDLVRIPVLEGEHPKVQRNHLIGDLTISGDKIRRDLPAGSDVEITVTLNESMGVQVVAFVPLLDQDFEVDFDLRMVRNSPEILAQDLEMQKERLAKVQQETGGDQQPAVTQALDRIEREGMIPEAESLAKAAVHDADAQTQLDRRLLDLAAAIDQAEDAQAWPKALADAEESKGRLQQLIDELKSVTHEDRSLHKRLLADLQQAIDNRDETQVRRCIDALDDLRFEILRREPGYWIARLEYAEENQSDMTDTTQAQRLIAQGHRAIQNNDIEGLQSAVRQLWQLWRRDSTAASRRYGDVIL